MLLKKQTVWLLTMLSLIIVLSVYYITAPGSGDDLAYLEKGKNTASTKQEQPAKNKKGSDAAVTSAAGDDLFTALRMKRDETRDELSSKYTAAIASPNASAEVQAEALAKISELQSLTMKESTLETLIKTMGYDDALVNTMDNEVRIIVKGKHSSNEAVKIMKKAEEQLGNKQVAVEFQKPAK
ncbi:MULTISPECIES: SpoIIIAH-like family protein [Fictibacillus]|uniref:SpoIIIAH-like family protein n=1 Tax=Fictibacillus terranigra TaxID=3058424 RepID=A0ABT8E9W3_9BACL|nr:SpoIIIAH-like family protein [Fictibacillus sp. CENA-BCM004]MDN4074702.1 SpoIIIAH-like family protein [Fictibacillus sp. CENA-BCM004]